MVDVDALVALAETVIPGDEPAGINARYEEAYEQLADEVAKLETLDDAQPDWIRVSDLAQTVLQDSSKDFMVGAWLAGALWENESYDGLVAGMAALRVLLRDFWDNGFPTRMRARRSALSWICDRAIAWLEADEGKPTREQLEALVETMGNMYSETEDKWDGDDPPIWQLQKRYQTVLDSRPAPVVEEAMPAPSVDEAMPAPAGVPDAMPAPVGVAAAGAALASGAVAVPAVAVGSIATRQQAFEALGQVASFIEQTEPHSPIVMLLRRAIEWSELSFAELYGQLLGKYPGSMAYVWDTLGIGLEDVPGGEGSLQLPDDAGGTSASVPAPTPPPAPAAPAASTPAPAGDAMPAPATDMPAPSPSPSPASDDGGMPPPTLM